jgi:hypothetical protein
MRAFHYALNCSLSVTDNIKMDLTQTELEYVYWNYVLGHGPLAARCEHGNGTSGFPKMQGISG